MTVVHTPSQQVATRLFLTVHLCLTDIAAYSYSPHCKISNENMHHP